MRGQEISTPPPSSWRPWTFKTICGLMHGEILCVRLLPDDAQEAWFGMLDVPCLMRVNQKPKFSLTMLLERTPEPSEISIRHLIVSGYLGMEISYALPEEARQEAGVFPLYARRASMKLEGSGGVTLADLELSTPLLRGAMHLHLKKDDVLGVLDALDQKMISTLKLKTVVEFQSSPLGKTITIDMGCAGLWDQFHKESPQGIVTEETAWRVFDQLVERRGIILPECDKERMFRLFVYMCGHFLCVCEGGYELGKRPSPSSHRFEEKWNSPVLRKLELDCTLDKVLGGALEGLDREAFLRVVGPGGTVGSGAVLSLLKRVRANGMRMKVLAKEGVAVIGSKLQTISATLQPSVTSYQTAHLLMTETLRPAAVVSSNTIATTYVSNNAVFYDATLLPIKRPRMPVVIDANAALFRDEMSAVHRWYLPSVQLVTPAPNLSPETSPYLFEFERTGSTSSGQPAIRARLRFTLELGMSAHTATELQSLTGVQARQIELMEPSVRLSVPYIDETDGLLKRAFYGGVLTREGKRLEVTLELLNDAARTTYGSLSTAGFQAERAQIQVSYQFQCLAPVLNRPHLLIGGKIAMARLLSPMREEGDGIRVGSGASELVFRVEPQGGAVKAGTISMAAAIMPMIGRPPLTLSATALALPQKLSYAQRTMIRQEKLDAFFSCETLGAFYRERSATGSVAIGCAEAFRLGQTSTKAYQEMAELANDSYRVYRNLQQPGRFLLLPAFYRVTRYAANMGDKAYRPIIMAYSVLDAEHPENNRILYEAMLAPGITPLQYRELTRLLSAEAQNPIIELPNTLAKEVAYHWDLSASLSVDVTVVRSPDCFDVSLATDVPGALLLKNVLQNTGVSGEAQFNLHDGTFVGTTLSIDLNQITGPWPDGGIAMRRNGRTVTLINKIERKVTVSDLYTYTGPHPPVRLPVERIISPEDSLEITGPESYDEAVVDASVLNDGTVSLEEVRAMVEDIHANVIFLDLVNYENHGLSRIQIDARLKGVAGTSQVLMENRRGTVDFLLPITTYLTTRILEYRVTKNFLEKPAEATVWLEWNMDVNSNVVSITWDQIG